MLVVEKQLPSLLREQLAERSWTVGIAPPATDALARVVARIAPPPPPPKPTTASRLRTTRGPPPPCVAPAYLPQVRSPKSPSLDARTARPRTRSDTVDL